MLSLCSCIEGKWQGAKIGTVELKEDAWIGRVLISERFKTCVGKERFAEGVTEGIKVKLRLLGPASQIRSDSISIDNHIYR